MEDLYPANPATVPEHLTKPTAAYKRHAWMAMGGLGLFVALYFALTGWFGWTAYRLLHGAMNGSSDGLLGFVGGVCAAFLTVFMAKAIFFVKHTYQIDDIEITAAEQPKLFSFLNRLADEAGAPRPHRVFLSPRVNAAVFYDLSILNLILPSKKNLEIGLGLVNVLTLGEVKAVLAHEFGHFAQRSMAVGRWVYIAQQIAGHIIAKRDALDAFLRGLSRFDLRIAWVGWILSLIIWSLRSVMETVFRLVVLAQRALSREMEFQADLVAVSLTGSDAIVNALHRLNVADTAWDRAAQFCYSEAHEGRFVTDVFAAQTLVIDRLRTVLDNPSYREPPPPPSHQPQGHRVFKSELAQPPRMWSTHPANVEREDNAKREYVAAVIDSRSAWELFREPQVIKEQMSTHIVREVTKKKPATAVPLDEALAKLSAQYDKAYLQPAYRGTYLGRSLTRHVKDPASLYSVLPARDTITKELDLLYPESLSAELDKLRQLESEKAALQALYEGFLTAPGGIIRHGGKELRRRDLPDAIEQVTEDLKATQDTVHAHDRRCRSAHLAAAATFGNGWDAYLKGLATVLHYADHAEADLSDAQGAMHNVYAVVTADGRVSGAELTRLIGSCSDLYRALRQVYDTSEHIVLDRTLTRRLSVENWTAALEKMDLPPPTEENISQWLNVIDSWVNGALGALSSLRLAALEQLLLSEAQVGNFLRKSMAPTAAPEPSAVKSSYKTLMYGDERSRQKRLDWWDRFQTADGVVATLARLAVAGAIIAAVVTIGGSVGTSSVVIYNGLARDVIVDIGASSTTLPPLGKKSIDIDVADNYQVTAKTTDGKVIESFQTDAATGFTHYVYNVAKASPLVMWTAVYGGRSEVPAQHLGTVAWTTTSAEHIFEEPPESISTKSGGGTRTVLAGFGDRSPNAMLSIANSDQDRETLLATHARWDDTRSKNILEWLMLAIPNNPSILQGRLQEQPLDTLLLRVEQDTAGEKHDAVCNRHRELASKDPANADLLYLTIRCLPHDQKNAAFIAAFRSNPKNSWLAMASGYAYADTMNWSDAQSALDLGRRSLPFMADSIAMDEIRVQRANNQAMTLDVIGNNPTMRFLMNPDSVPAHDDYAAAYDALNKAHFETAEERAQKVGDDLFSVVRLIGASDGANREQIAKALLSSDQKGLDINTIWSTYALAKRERVDASFLKSFIEHLGDPESIKLMRAIDSISDGGTVNDSTLSPMAPSYRGHAYSAGVVLLGPRAPERWREKAKQLLFIHERPYFN